MFQLDDKLFCIAAKPEKILDPLDIHLRARFAIPVL